MNKWLILLLAVTILSIVYSSSADDHVTIPQADEEAEKEPNPTKQIKRLKWKIRKLRMDINNITTDFLFNRLNIQENKNNQLILLQQMLNLTTVYLPQQLATINKRIDQLSEKINSKTAGLIKGCRVCLLVSGPHNQCQGHRKTCSGWSTSPSYSPYYRDDTDNRGGGCYMHWKLECK